VVIQGTGARDVGNNFVQRWNDYHSLKRHAGSWTKEKSALKPRQPMPASPGTGSMYVQVLRTSPCHFSDVPEENFDFAPEGENTILSALMKAIHNARHFIYIEDQYGLWVTEIHDALEHALARIDKLVVLLAHSELSMFGCLSSMHNMWHSLHTAYPDKVVIVTTRTEEVYVHSKTWVIDDVYFLTGSANLNRRSYTMDQEMSVAVMDSEKTTNKDGYEVLKFAHDARVKMWAELLNLSVDAVKDMKIAEGAKLFGGEKTQTVQYKKLDEDWKIRKEACDLTDPDKRCKNAKIRRRQMYAQWMLQK